MDIQNKHTEYLSAENYIYINKAKCAPPFVLLFGTGFSSSFPNNSVNEQN